MDVREESPFGKLLRAYRADAGLSQEALAERAGLSARGISDLERGARRVPHSETVRLLADALNLGSADRSALLGAARPARSGGAAPVEPPYSSIPLPPTPLVGRTRELETLVTLLGGAERRLVTLTGPGGVGKTRLALEVARTMADLGARVHLVELGALHDPSLVASALASALCLRDAGGVSVAITVEHYLRDKQLLLVLDNLEHLLPAAPLLARLLARSPGLKILTTSRVPLGLLGERRFLVSPLSLPACGRDPAPCAVIGAEAVRMFVARARDVQPDFTLHADDAWAVAEICRRLDGLPLALELAAVHIPVLPPAALLSRLDRHRLGLLQGDAPDLPERHHTLRDAIGWSYDLLSSGDQCLFRRLAVFSGGWTLHAAEAVTGVHGDLDILEGMSTLIKGNLVYRQGESAGREPRFVMLGTIQECARELLAEHDEEASTRTSHTAWMLGLVERAGPALVGPDQAMWLSRLDQEMGNLRTALAWAVARGDSETALRLASTPWLFWFERGHASEGRAWIAKALELSDHRPAVARAEALYASGSLAATQADYHQAEILLETALADWEALGDTVGISHTRHNLGTVALQQNQNQRAADLLEQALSGYDAPPHSIDAPWVALALSQLAAAVSRLGDREHALELAETGLAKQQAAGSVIGVALALAYLGDIALDWGDHATARERYAASMTLLLQQGDRWHLLHALTGYLTVLSHHGPPERVARLCGALTAARVVIGYEIPPRYRPTYDAAVLHLQSELGEEAFSALQAEGAKLDLEEAVAEAVQN